MNSNNTSTIKSRSRGMLLGLAIGDTLLKMPKCPILRTRFEDDENFKTPD